MFSNQQEQMQNTLIPIIIDDVKESPDFQMTRCSYFTVECDVPTAIEVSVQRIFPVLLLGMSAVIIGPLDGQEQFSSLYSLTRLFEDIESQSDCYIDMNDLWLPNYLLPSNAGRGNVCRIPADLFTEALNFRKGKMDQDRFEGYCREYGVIKVSSEESSAFKDWSVTQIEDAKKIYNEREPNRNLEYSENN